VFWIGWDYCRNFVGMGGHDINDDNDNDEREEEEKGERRLGLLSAKPRSLAVMVKSGVGFLEGFCRLRVIQRGRGD
jgi:hypothetical protein